ncbi:hypothetical protein OBRU01_25569, partial [Operophtera brumata]
EEYRLMPPMLRLDPYESCMRHPGAVYCTASMTFVSDEPSPLLTLMQVACLLPALNPTPFRTQGKCWYSPLLLLLFQEYSEHRSTHFNHTRVLYGTCMTTTCPTFYNTAVDLRLNLEACRNKTLYEEYKLRVQVEDDVSCVGGKHDENQIGPAQIVMAAILIALVMLNVIGSLYDVFCKEKSGPVVRSNVDTHIPKRDTHHADLPAAIRISTGLQHSDHQREVSAHLESAAFGHYQQMAETDPSLCSGTRSDCDLAAVYRNWTSLECK